MRNTKGFTLIELLVAILVIGILALAVVPLKKGMLDSEGILNPRAYTFFGVVLGIPLILAIANLFLRIVLGYWSPLFKWLLLGYLAILGAFAAGILAYFRALEKSQEVERQRSLVKSMDRIAESLRRNPDYATRISLEKVLKEVRR